MNNYMSDGNTLTLTAPGGGVVTGQGYVIGGLFVVALATVAAGAKFAAVKAGVVELSKDGVSAHVEGEQVFWDNTAKTVKESASGFYPIGHAVKVTLAATTKVMVALSNQHLVVVP